MIRDDEDCDECGVAAVRRECDECGVSAMITDCGCQIQPRPLSADGRRTYCDDCYEDRADRAAKTGLPAGEENMRSYDVIGYVYDGAAFCDECKPTVRDDESPDEIGVIFAENDFETIGATCGGCNACYTGAGWQCREDATNANYHLWSKCSECNAQRPHERSYAAEEVQELRHGGCASCGRKNTVRLIAHQR